MMRIEAFRADQNEAARAVIFSVAYEFFGENQPFDEWRARVSQTWLARDVDDLAAHYGGENGAFWVLLDGEEVVGTCGVRRIKGEATCELKRMYFLPRVRGQGWGRAIAQVALDWARGAGFELMRLDTDSELVAARALYQSLGFTPIERYNENNAELFYELKLR